MLASRRAVLAHPRRRCLTGFQLGLSYGTRTSKCPPDDKPNPLQGSNAAFSWKQARDLFFAPDWHPDDHSAMPEIVASGRKPDVRACGSCHRVEGTGGPENASLAGLPVSYFVQQLADFKSGARKMSGPERPSTQFMMASAKGI